MTNTGINYETFFQVICNALWYITNQHSVINDASLRKKTVLPIPCAFQDYTGYDDTRRKKVKAQQLTQSSLTSHSEALVSLLLKPVFRTTPAWSKAEIEIKQLSDCLLAYANHLKMQLEVQVCNQKLDHPVRTLDEHATMEHRHKCALGVRKAYAKLDADVRAAGIGSPVLFDESKHLDIPFTSNTERYRFMHALQLSMSVDIIRFCPGGSTVTTVAVVQAPEKRSEPEILVQGVKLLQRCREHLKEYHTRAQRKMFKDKLTNVANILPSVAELIYTELCIDGAAANHPEMQQRLRLIFLGDKGLLTDLRHLNTGRPTNKFDIFFEKLEMVVEQVTAADDRRQNISHLSQWISLKELIQQAEGKCPTGTPIPSASLVRLQFAPRNPYTHRALSFTSKISVQYKIQRRQLRVSHPDDHYCAAQLLYVKERACEMRDSVVFLCCDDKAKIPIGDPGSAVSTGVRGKKTLAPTTTTLASLDHDMTRASVTPSVILQCAIPEVAEKSFVRGKVTTIVNDSIFQMSSPFRHGAAIAKLLAQSTAPIVMKFTDGGTDQRNTLESVKCATICLFVEMNLDMVILARCAPGHSWTNPAERVMSILNLGLQNCALERPRCDDDAEKVFNRCGSMADMRKQAVNKPELQLQSKWKEAIKPIQEIVRGRFERLSLKDEPIATMDPVSDEDIVIYKRHLSALFPELDQAKLQKIHTQKVPTYTEWVERHCRCRHYTFQVSTVVQSERINWYFVNNLELQLLEVLKCAVSCCIQNEDTVGNLNVIHGLHI